MGKIMRTISRSEFLKSAVAGVFLSGGRAGANPLGLPIGLQPYTVRNDLKADFEGTLRKVAAMGYKEIEVSGGEGYGDFFGHKPAELRKILDDFRRQRSRGIFSPSPWPVRYVAHQGPQAGLPIDH